MSAAKTSKKDNQSKAPRSAAFVKEMREAFGEDQVTVLYVNENGLKLGEPSEDIHNRNARAA